MPRRTWLRSIRTTMISISPPMLIFSYNLRVRTSISHNSSVMNTRL